MHSSLKKSEHFQYVAVAVALRFWCCSSTYKLALVHFRCRSTVRHRLHGFKLSRDTHCNPFCMRLQPVQILSIVQFLAMWFIIMQ